MCALKENDNNGNFYCATYSVGGKREKEFTALYNSTTMHTTERKRRGESLEAIK